jgi:hypothetical protein
MMKRPVITFLLLACTFLTHSLAEASPIRTYVAEFKVPAPDPAGLKSTLQTLLSSRLAVEGLTPATQASEADVIVTGSYTQLGKFFSLDAVAKLGSGKTLATVFEQSENQDDLIPAIGRISGKLKTEILQRYQQASLPPAPAKAAVAPASAPVPAAPASGSTLWLSQRILNAQSSVAPAQNRGEARELFVAEPHALRVYRQEKTLKLVAEVSFPLREKVIAIDSIGPDAGGNPRVYVTVLDNENPASKIFSFEGGKLKLVAQKLPYLFRAIALNGEDAKMYAQQMGITEDYFGDLFEVSETAGKIELKNPIKMPRYGNVFNYNKVKGPDGRSFATVLSSDGYLIVYSEDNEEIWRSNDKFGGSETFFQRDAGNVREVSEKLRWTFIDQRIVVTPKGEVLVPQNTGFFVLGNNRSYSKYSLVSLSWNGSSLEEAWRTKQSQNYLADFFLDPTTRELVLLEVVQKSGIFSKGGSAVRVIRAD